jgi:protein TonB
LWLAAAFTLALWLACLAVGIGGVVLHYVQPHLPPVETPVVAQLIHVELSNEPVPADSGSTDKVDPAPAQADDISPPPAPVPATPSAAPPLMAVATPDPAIAFAVPVKGPAQIVSAKQAAPQQPGTAAKTAGPVVHHLVFGRGEGKQPPPEYPREAEMQRQEGVVGIQFVVTENGGVAAPEIVAPCRWPMLNQEVLRTVRDRWHFAPGERRLCEIYIHFQLADK